MDRIIGQWLITKEISETAFQHFPFAAIQSSILYKRWLLMII